MWGFNPSLAQTDLHLADEIAPTFAKESIRVVVGKLRKILAMHKYASFRPRSF